MSIETTTDDAAAGAPDGGSPRAPLGTAARGLYVSNALDITSRRVLDLVVDATAVLAVGASATQIGLLNAAGTLAFLLLGVPIGVLVDRHDARRAMTLALGARALILASLAWMLTAGPVSFWVLAAVSLLVGISGAVAETGQTVYAARIVPASQVGRLAARLQSADSVLSLVAPAAAGLLLGRLGASWLVVAAAVLAVAAASALGGRRKDGVVAPVASGPTAAAAAPSRGLLRFVAEVRAGLDTFRADTLLRRLTLATALTNAGLAGYSSVSTILELRVLDLGTEVFGVLVAVGGAGGLLGGTLAEALARRLPRARVVVGSTTGLALVSALPLVAAQIHAVRGDGGPSAALPLALIGVHAFGWGLFSVIGIVQVAALVAERVPADVLGRVVALRRTMTYGVVPVAAVAAGLLADLAGLTAVLVTTVLVTVAAAALLAAAVRTRA